MANLASSGVTTTDSWVEAYAGKKVRARKVTVVLSSMGSATNTIPAAAFGLSTILECTPLVKSDDSVVVVAHPSYSGAIILLKAAGTNAPADYSGTFRCIVRGQ